MVVCISVRVLAMVRAFNQLDSESVDPTVLANGIMIALIASCAAGLFAIAGRCADRPGGGAVSRYWGNG